MGNMCYLILPYLTSVARIIFVPIFSTIVRIYVDIKKIICFSMEFQRLSVQFYRKVMETLINHRLMKYLEENNLISDHQYGFGKKRSTGNNLTTYLSEK